MKEIKAYITRPDRLSAGMFEGKPTSYTIHSTGNPKSTARNERDNLQNNAGTTSFHSVVDDKEVIRCIPFNHRAWHAGDGRKKNGGNMTSLSLEICESGDREQTLANAAEVVANDMILMGLTIEDIVQHNHWTGKNCPRILRETNRWSWFIERIKKEVKHLSKYQTVIDCPAWAREAITWAVKYKVVNGTENGLDLTEDDLREIVWLYRTFNLWRDMRE